MAIPPLKLPGAPAAFPKFDDRLKRTLARYAAKFRSLALLGAAGVLTLAVLTYSATLTLRGNADWRSSALVGAGAALIALLVVIIWQVSVSAVAAFKIGPDRALGLGFGRIFSAWWAQLLASLIAGAAGLLLIVPGLALAVRFGLTIPVMLAEDRRGREALLRSRDLVYGRTLALWVQVLVVKLLALAGAAVAWAVGWLVLRLVPATFLLPPNIPAAWPLAVTAGALVLSLTLPLPIVFLQIFYEDAVADRGLEWRGAPQRGRIYLIIAGAGLAVAVGGLALLLTFAPLKSLWSGYLIRIIQPTAPAVTTTAPPEKPPLTLEERDLERYRQVNTIIRLALAAYKRETGAYPQALSDLVPNFLKTVPTDPVSGETFAYVRTAAGYTLKFRLEKSLFTLAAGDHVMTPKGLDIPGEANATPMPTAQPPEVSKIPGTVIEEPSNPLPPPPDADSDGLSDAEELSLGTDPAKADTDGDGLTDREEVVFYRTDPKKADTDGDGFNDGDEVYAGFDPLSKTGQLPDGDGDGLADIYETVNGLNPQNADMDGDGLSDGDELRIFGTDPKNPDTDGDGFNDGAELKSGHNPLGSDDLTSADCAITNLKIAQFGLHQPTIDALGWPNQRCPKS